MPSSRPPKPAPRMRIRDKVNGILSRRSSRPLRRRRRSSLTAKGGLGRCRCFPSAPDHEPPRSGPHGVLAIPGSPAWTSGTDPHPGGRSTSRGLPRRSGRGRTGARPPRPRAGVDDGGDVALRPPPGRDARARSLAVPASQPRSRVAAPSLHRDIRCPARRRRAHLRGRLDADRRPGSAGRRPRDPARDDAASPDARDPRAAVRRGRGRLLARAERDRRTRRGRDGDADDRRHDHPLERGRRTSLRLRRRGGRRQADGHPGGAGGTRPRTGRIADGGPPRRGGRTRDHAPAQERRKALGLGADAAGAGRRRPGHRERLDRPRRHRSSPPRGTRTARRRGAAARPHRRPGACRGPLRVCRPAGDRPRRPATRPLRVTAANARQRRRPGHAG